MEDIQYYLLVIEEIYSIVCVVKRNFRKIFNNFKKAC